MLCTEASLRQEKQRFDCSSLVLFVQAQRERVLADFRSGRFDVLVASDVASRGLDIASVRTVVHARGAGMLQAEEYVHRFVLFCLL